MRSISNFIEYATLSYLTDEAFVSDAEMDQIVSDAELVDTLKQGQHEIASERYRVVEYVHDSRDRVVPAESASGR